MSYPKELIEAFRDNALNAVSGNPTGEKQAKRISLLESKGKIADELRKFAAVAIINQEMSDDLDRLEKELDEINKRLEELR
jgi:hypothetical protein